MVDQTGANNPNWKGGRIVEPRGYILIRVGKGHPLADCRGYAYEHRLKAEEALGRPLRPGEEVHHDNEVKGDNADANIIVAASSHEHNAMHRRVQRKYPLRMPGEANPKVLCECGCGSGFIKYDASGRPRRFVPGHNARKSNHGR